MLPTTTVECPTCGDLLGTKDFIPNKGAICPRCGTMVEFAVLRQAMIAAAAATPATMPDGEATQAPPPQPLPQEPGPLDPDYLDKDQQRTPPRQWVQQLGVGVILAFTAFSVSLLLASIGPLAMLSKPLSGLGLLIAIGALLTLPHSSNVPAGLTVAFLCLLALIFIGPWPRWSSPQRPMPPLAAIAIEESKVGMVPDRLDVTDDMWLDAAAYAIRRKDLRVQVMGAMLGDVPFQITDPKVTAPKGPYLVIYLAVLCDSMRARDLTYVPWASTQQSRSEHPPTLIDDKDRTYAQDTFDPSLKVGGRGQRQFVTLGTQFREVLVYPGEAASAEYLHLELPAAAYGGEGTFRFELQRRMIKAAPQPTPPPTSSKKPLGQP
jgi:hypothetical protein